MATIQAEVADVQFKTGYLPGLLTRSIQMRMNYHIHAGLEPGLQYETDLAKNLTELVRRLENPDQRTQVWTANLHGQIVGTIYIDYPLTESAQVHLRAFIVDEAIRRRGVGRRMLADAIAFTEERGYEEIRVWTLKDVDQASKLYRDFGFDLAREAEGTFWGRVLVAQLFIRKLGAAVKVPRNTVSAPL